jgi:transcriptional regulator with XRE-family HTH domain
MIVERIEELIKESGQTAHSVLMNCHIVPNAFTVWKSGKSKPSLKALIKLADYFNVTVDFLVGREPPKEKVIPNEIQKIWEAWEILDDENKTALLQFTYFIERNDRRLGIKKCKKEKK